VCVFVCVLCVCVCVPFSNHALASENLIRKIACVCVCVCERESVCV
jgi:hypothetical protein